MARTKRSSVRRSPKKVKETTPTTIPSEEELSEESHKDISMNQKGKGKEKWKNAPLKFSKEVQVELAEWLRSHPILYDRSLDEFHMPDKKNQLCEAKAIELAPRHPLQTVTAARLMDQWYKGLRTRYTKAKAEVEKKCKSGSGGGSVLAGKKKRIFETF